jgi:hypothetical protein
MAIACLEAAGCATIRHADYIRSDGPLRMAQDGPRIRLDRNASGLRLLYDVGQASSYDREEVLSAIEAMWNQGKPTDAPVVPARIFVKASIVDERGWLWAIAMGYLYGGWSLFGGPTYSATATVDVDIEIQGKATLSGSGTGKCYAGMWYPGDPSACAFGKAIANAIMRGAM